MAECSIPLDKKSKPVTTKQKISALLNKTRGFDGHKKAVQALKYVENGSASIMESILYMMLSLPHSFGRLGLTGAVLNKGIKLKPKVSQYLNQNRCFLDLYYKKSKIAVEYNSFTHHNSASQQGHDQMRTTALEFHGIEVVPLTTIQLYDEAKFNLFVHELATRWGKRIRIRAENFRNAHAKIRMLLPASPDQILRESRSAE